MKKICFAFLFVAIFVVSGCTNVATKQTQVVPEVPTAFEGNCTVEYKGMVVKLHILRPNEQSCTMSVTEPETLKGLKIEYENEELYVSYSIIRQKLDTEKIPQAAFAPTIIGIFDKIASNLNTKPAAQGDSFVFTIDSSYGVIDVEIDQQTQEIKTISIQDQQLFITFDSFVKL